MISYSIAVFKWDRNIPSSSLLTQVEEIREVVDSDLGFQQVETKCPSKTKTFLFISNDKKVSGCLIAEHIQEVRHQKPSASLKTTNLHKNDSKLRDWACGLSPGLPGDRGASARGLGGREGDVWAAEGLVLLHHAGAGHLRHQPHLGGQHDETPEHRLAHAGVPQVKGTVWKHVGLGSRVLLLVFIFLFPSHRRNNFAYGSYLSKDEIAFSDPTPDGKLFATHYFGTSQFLVYNFVSGTHPAQPKTNAVWRQTADFIANAQKTLMQFLKLHSNIMDIFFFFFFNNLNTLVMTNIGFNLRMKTTKKCCWKRKCC